MLSYLFIVNNIIPLIIIIIGLFGNTVSLIVLSRKNLKQIGPVLIYKLLFISDSLYLGIYILEFNLSNFLYIYNLYI
jgi:hypothetical protein